MKGTALTAGLLAGINMLRLTPLALTKPPPPPPPPPRPGQDVLAAEIVNTVTRQRDLHGAAAMRRAIRTAERALVAKGAHDRAMLGAAALLALATLSERDVAGAAGATGQPRRLGLYLMGQNLVGVARDGAMNAADKARTEKLLLNSDYAGNLGSGAQLAGQALELAETSQLSASAKARLEHTILGSRLVQSLPAPKRKFLKAVYDAGPANARGRRGGVG